jgi:hypothetical protein
MEVIKGRTIAIQPKCGHICVFVQEFRGPTTIQINMHNTARGHCSSCAGSDPGHNDKCCRWRKHENV